MKNTALANELLKKLFDDFKTGKITETISKIPLIKDKDDDRPCWNWTLRNRILMVKQGSLDARNFKEWQKVHRIVKKGSKAIYILAPLMTKFKVKIKNDESKEEEEKEELRIYGFKCTPEFRSEDTQGVKLKEYKPSKIPPLLNVAKEWGIKINYRVDPSFSSYGDTNAQQDKEKDNINLGTDDPFVFFHELAHQADKKVNGNLKGGQDQIQEATAELIACVLCELHNIKSHKALTWNYLRNLTKKKTDAETEKLALKVIDRVGKVLELILTTAEKLNQKPIAMEIKIK